MDQPQDAAAAAPSTRGHSAGRRRRSANADLWLQAVLAIMPAVVGIMLAFGVVGWRLVETTERSFEQAQQSRDAAVIAGLINGRVAELSQIMANAGRSAIAVEGVTGNSETARSEAEAVLLKLIPNARRVDVIPRGKAEVDLSADVPITFAALDVIKRAETAAFVGPEASLSQRKTFYVASPITAKGLVIGMLFTALADDFLLSSLNATFDNDRGLVSLVQQFEGTAPTQVLKWGSEDASTRKVTMALAIPNWTLQYQSPAQRVPVTGGWGELLMPLGLAIGLTLGGIALAFSRLARRLTADAQTLTEYAGKLVRGASAPPRRYHSTLFADISRKLKAQAEAPGPTGEEDRAVGAVTKSGSVSSDVVSELLAGNDSDDTGDKQGEDNFGIEVSEGEETKKTADRDAPQTTELDPEIFRAYDIRGIVDSNLGEAVVYRLGRAFAAEALAENQGRVVIGRDGRLSSPGLANALAQGLTEGGVDVVDIGQVPTPVLYFATHALNTGTGIMVTGSHNPPQYNGLKMMIGGTTLAEARILGLRQRIEQNNLSSGKGGLEAVDIVPAYIERVIGDIALAQPIKVVADCGNGVAGQLVPELLTQLGCDVVPLYCEVDGNFPNHHPDPAEPKNLEDLRTVLEAEDADIGLAFDGDGDRLGVMTRSGTIIWPDKLMMLFSQDIVSRNPGADIVYDVKCSRHLNSLISDYGGRPIMWRTGHSNIKAKMKETGALLGGEFSGHICFGERWYGFDDALYSAARLLEIITAEGTDADDLFAQFPVTHSTPEIKINTTEKEKFRIMKQLEQQANFGDGTLTTIDGLRVDFADSWGLVRPSNTSPVLSLRFEADNPAALEQVQEIFQEQLTAISSALSFR